MISLEIYVYYFLLNVYMCLVCGYYLLYWSSYLPFYLYLVRLIATLISAQWRMYHFRTMYRKMKISGMH